MLNNLPVDKNTFYNMINEAKTIAMFGHVRPDGDCCGSILSLYNYISENIPGKKMTIFLQQIPDTFRFLKNADVIVNEPSDEVFDLGISLDCSDTDRHAEFKEIFRKSKKTICIDHHKTNEGFGDYYYCDPDASSTAEIMYRFYDDEKISKECAECIYLGLIHDTGVFKYSSTSEQTMNCAGRLISKGINTQYIIDYTFYQMTYKQNLLKSQAVLDSKLFLNGKIIATCVNLDTFAKYNANKNDVEGIVDQLRLTEGIEVAIFAYQLSEDRYKFSLRSIEKVDVSDISTVYHGGGHSKAAGFEAKGDYNENLENIIELVKKQL